MRRLAYLTVLALLGLLAACGGSAERSSVTPNGQAETVAPKEQTGPTTAPESAEPPPETSTTQTPPDPPFEDVVAKVRTGVIRIQVDTCDGSYEGTGILVGPKLVATVEHVIAGAVNIDLRQRGKSVAKGTVIGYDVERDVALVRSNKPIEGHHFTFASRAPRLGEKVAAIGFPLGLRLTVTDGLVSGLNRSVDIEGIRRRRLVQTDAALNPGNSGGPLFSVRTGEVVGLVSAGSLEVNAIGFAVPAKTVAALVAAWRSSPQPVEASACAEPPPPVGEDGGGSETFSGYFTSYDRLESCYADGTGASCAALPSGKAVSLAVGLGAFYEGIVADPTDLGGPALQLGDSFTTPGGTVTCGSSSRGITCTDSTTGFYFVIGDYEVKTNNGGGEESF